RRKRYDGNITTCLSGLALGSSDRPACDCLALLLGGNASDLGDWLVASLRTFACRFVANVLSHLPAGVNRRGRPPSFGLAGSNCRVGRTCSPVSRLAGSHCRVVRACTPIPHNWSWWLRSLLAGSCGRALPACRRAWLPLPGVALRLGGWFLPV